MSRKQYLFSLAVIYLACMPTAIFAENDRPLKFGAKAFTESVILANVAKFLCQATGVEIEPVAELGGTQVLWSALRTGEVDVYPEYTGTIRQEILRDRELVGFEALSEQLRSMGIGMTKPIGFNNTYALGVSRETADRYGLKKLSDLSRYPELSYGFSNEFIDRGDGWPSLKAVYKLHSGEVQGLEHALAYRALDSGEVDVIDVYTTDPNIRKYDLMLLEDDLSHFPEYEAIYLYRIELEKNLPQVVDRLHQLGGRLSNDEMLVLNEEVELNRKTEKAVAANFVEREFGVQAEVVKKNLWQRILKSTQEHLFLVLTSLFAAMIVGVPAGIIAAKANLPGQIILGLAEIVQTIPGLALLVFMGVVLVRFNLPSIGALPVILALFLYSLLPIIRNTKAGLEEIPQQIIESATALGLGWWPRLKLIELPLATPLILAGIKTTAVINVGYAALGGLVGAGGYGQPIMTGLRLNSESHMLEGAIPAAILALLVKWTFEWVELWVVPKGLRLGNE